MRLDYNYTTGILTDSQVVHWYLPGLDQSNWRGCYLPAQQSCQITLAVIAFLTGLHRLMGSEDYCNNLPFILSYNALGGSGKNFLSN